MVPPKKKLVCIINPIAGKGKGADFAKIIASGIDQRKFDFNIQISEHSNHVSILTQNAISNNADVIIGVGGDGTINQIASHLIDTEIALGIVPLGSGNGLGNFLNIPSDISKSLELINTFRIRRIDTGIINGLCFVSVAGVGFDATVARSYAQSENRGFRTYFKSSVRNYFSYKPAKYKIRTNDTVIARKALLITFANSDQFGYNTSISPQASIDDGYLDMCIMKKVPVLKAPFVALKLFRKKIHTSVYHEMFRIKEATLFRKRTSVIQIDGEPVVMKDKTIHVKIKPKSLSVIC